MGTFSKHDRLKWLLINFTFVFYIRILAEALQNFNTDQKCK